jgi:outer membrane receptor protein involved in Fe transport
VLVSRDEFGQPPSTTGFAPVFRRTDEETLLHGQAGVEGEWTEAVSGRVALFYSRYTTEESEFDGPDFRTQVLETDVDSDEFGGIGRLSFALHERDQLAAGGVVRQSRADVSNRVRGDLVDPEVTTVSGGLENVWTPFDFATVVAGLSYDLQTGGGRGTDGEVNPRGGFSFDLGRCGEARVAVARKTRFPTLRQLFDPLQGNDDLDPETALVYEVGHRFEVWRAAFDAAFFRSEVDDFVDSEGGGGSDPQPSVNLNEARLQGVEASAALAPIEPVALALNYTFLDAEARDRGGDFSEIQHRPEHRFNGILAIFLPWQSRLRLEGLYTSEQLDRFGGSIHIDDFALFNFDLSKTFGDWLELFAGVTNALDVDYEERLGTPRPGRRTFAGVRARY